MFLLSLPLCPFAGPLPPGPPWTIEGVELKKVVGHQRDDEGVMANCPDAHTKGNRGVAREKLY